MGRFMSDDVHTEIAGKRIAVNIANSNTATTVGFTFDGCLDGRIIYEAVKIFTLNENTSIYARIYHYGTGNITLQRSNVMTIGANGNKSGLYAVRIK